MHINKKQINVLFFKSIAVISMLILMSSFSGCVHKETMSMDTDSEGDNSEINIFEQEQNVKNDIESWLFIGLKVRELDSRPGMNEPVILVDGYSIIKKEIEIQKIYSECLNNATIKENIVSLIREKAIKAEATRLGVQPPREKIEAYLEQVKRSLNEKTIGTETILAYMEGLEITQEEYLSMLEETAYDMYQREELRILLESLHKEKDYEEYVNEIVKRAKIEILDADIEKLLR